MEPEKPRCRHCRFRAAKLNSSRRLCGTCYQDGGIKDLYPLAPRAAPADAMTEAELDALVERQRANLPAWWPRLPAEIERERTEEE